MIVKNIWKVNNMKLIDKSKLLEELRKCEKICEDYMFSHKDAVRQGIANAKRAMCQHIIKIINNLEVKEVDLEKELENLIEKEKAFVTDNREVKYYNGDSFNHIYELEFIAKYFFELGLKTKKGE